MLVDAAAWHRLGGFDEQYFMYAEEVDLCKRIANFGGVLLCDPRIRLLHDTGSGERRTPRRMLLRAKGNATFYRKHYGPIQAALCLSLLLLHALSRECVGRLLRRPAYVQSFGSIVSKRKEWWYGWPQSTSNADIEQ